MLQMLLSTQHGTDRSEINTELDRILRGVSMFKEVIEGRFEGRRPRGRKRKSLLEDLKGNKSYHQLKRLAQDRRAWQMTDPCVDLPLGRTQDDDDDIHMSGEGV